MKPTAEKTVLIVGSGGREHALAARLGRSAARVLVAPGNGGTFVTHENRPVAVDDLDAIVDLARRERVDLAVIGPEVPLVLGLCDRLRDAGVITFGPSAAAARLEGSKAFMKEFARRHQIPTAPFSIFQDEAAAVQHIRARKEPLVVKADGLCAGKGVIVAGSPEEAIDGAREMLSGRAFGMAGTTVVIESQISGAEASVHAICSGTEFFLLPAVQDHKRIGEGDVGPNTGGMGAYGPAPVVTPALERRIAEEMIRPTLRGLAAEGTPFFGALFAGVMIQPDGDPILLEYNVRFGDPETEVLMALLEGDVTGFLWEAAQGRLQPERVQVRPHHAIAVVLAAKGYPGHVQLGAEISGLEAAGEVSGVQVLHAGTRREGDQTLVAGGRVLVVTATGETLAQAHQQAYRAVERISFDGMQVRRDIGHRAGVGRCASDARP